MTPYFAYGSNMSTPRLEQRVGSVRVLGRARLAGYCHRFSKHGNDGSAKGNIEPALGEQVWGALYELDSVQLARLEQFESGYRMVTLDVSLNGVSLGATSFEGLEIVRGLEPTRAYLNHYIAGMREHAIPEHYRHSVLRDLSPLPQW